MPKQWSNIVRFYVGTYDVTSHTTRFSVNRGNPALDVTAVGDNAESAIAGRRADAIEWAGLFDDVGTGLDVAMATFVGSALPVSILIGSAVGARAFSGTGLFLTHKASGDVGGLAVLDVTLQPNDKVLAGVAFGTGTTVGATYASGSLDDGAPTTAGCTVFWHVFQAVSGTFGMAVQDSADGTTFATIGTLTQSGTAAIASVATATGTIKRYVKLVGGVGGTGTASAAVVFARG